MNIIIHFDPKMIKELFSNVYSSSGVFHRNTHLLFKHSNIPACVRIDILELDNEIKFAIMGTLSYEERLCILNMFILKKHKKINMVKIIRINPIIMICSISKDITFKSFQKGEILDFETFR